MHLREFDELLISQPEDVLIEFALTWVWVGRCLLAGRGDVQLLNQVEEVLRRQLTRVQLLQLLEQLLLIGLLIVACRRRAVI